ncbi:uncharacterized protein FIBRA_08471 [Fibroporia radiculosa]|uniref:Aminotransferase class V domain-containing protein n=1 Tax=Fibroporia radiculosa TaxID=599839 RepID=J4GWV2_9APHY|nr:uncharacterized protein FIBRA_08471 [Fibroporia radiculosa]CCM06225.1 predicted protein [Fibroporia radiculosa]
MPPQFARIRGAQGFQQSNPSVLATAALLGALQVFERAGGMGPVRARSVRMTGYLEALLRQSAFWVSAGEGMRPARRVGVAVITPTEPAERGAQLSLLFLPTGRGVMPRVLEGLSAHGVVGDSRKPDVIRLAPCVLYNTWEDVERAVSVLEQVLEQIDSEGLDA